jgi:hypothetical protein
MVLESDKIEDVRLKKGEADQKIINFLKKNKESIFSIDEIKEKANFQNRSTVSTSLNRLEKNNKVISFRDNNKDGQEVKKYQLVSINEKITEDYLDKLIEKYEEAEAEGNIIFMKLAIEDFSDISIYNKILYEKYVRFLIEHSKKGKWAKPLFLTCLTSLAYKFKDDIRWNKKGTEAKQEKKLFNIIKRETQFVDDIIYNKMERLDERKSALLCLSEIDLERSVIISFDLIKKLDFITPITEFKKDKKKKNITEFENFRPTIRKIILRYANVNFGDCRLKILDELSGKHRLEDPVLREIWDLYEFTKPGFEEREKQAKFVSINPYDAVKYNQLKNKLKEKGINLDD